MTCCSSVRPAPHQLAHQRGEEDDGEEYAARPRPRAASAPVVASFLILFAAESRTCRRLTISLVARYDAPLEVFIGALAALLAVSGLAVIAGSTLMRFVQLHVLLYVEAMCLPGARGTASLRDPVLTTVPAMEERRRTAPTARSAGCAP